MNINFENKNGKSRIGVSGRLDSASAEEFKTKTIELCKGTSDVTIDMSSLDYISSAGLRSILSLKKSLGPGAVLRIENAHGIVKEVLEISDFNELIG